MIQLPSAFREQPMLDISKCKIVKTPVVIDDYCTIGEAMRRLAKIQCLALVNMPLAEHSPDDLEGLPRYNVCKDPEINGCLLDTCDEQPAVLAPEDILDTDSMDEWLSSKEGTGYALAFKDTKESSFKDSYAHNSKVVKRAQISTIAYFLNSGYYKIEDIKDLLTPNRWAKLLTHKDMTQFAEHCPWDKLTGYDVAIIIESEEGNQLTRNKLFKPAIVHKMSGYDMVRYLSHTPNPGLLQYNGTSYTDGRYTKADCEYMTYVADFC